MFKHLRFFLSLLLIGLNVTPAYVLTAVAQETQQPVSAPASEETTEKVSSLRENPGLHDFLVRLGFEDYSQQITDNLERARLNRERPGLAPVVTAKPVLEFNRDRYQIVNNARNLAVHILDSLEAKMQDPETRTRLTQLTARMLAFQPTSPPDEFPAEINNIKNEEQRDAEKARYLTQVIKDNIKKNSDQLLSDVLKALYGRGQLADILDGKNGAEAKQALEKEIYDLYGQITNYIQIAYLDPEIGQTKFLGRALALSVARYSKKNNDKDLLKDLEEQTRKEGQFLDNFISNKVIFVDKNGEEKSATIHNGDFVMEYSGGLEAAQIASAVRPRGVFSRMKSYKEKLLGWLVTMLIHKDMDDVTENTELKFIDKVRMALAENPLANMGYSHVGLATVHTDPETGIKSTWMMDNYPNADYGGIRFIGVEQFAMPGPYKRFGVAHYDPKKFLAWAKEQKARGYKKFLQDESDFYTLDSEGALVKDEKVDADGKPRKFRWQTEISEEEFNALVDKTPEQAREWFEKEIAPRVMGKMKEFMVKDGLGFAYGFINGGGFGYCSETINKAFLLSTGLDPQQTRDRWAYPLQIAKRLELGPTKEKDFESRITAPSGYAWQSGLMAENGHTMIDFRSFSRLEEAQNRFAPPYVEMDTRITNILQSTPILADFSSEASTAELEGIIHEHILANELFRRKKDTNYAKAAMHGTAGRRSRVSMNQVASSISDEDGSEPLELTKRTPDELKGVQKDIREFLFRIGFENYSEMAQESIREQRYVNEIGRQTLVDNERRYQIINSGRELAVTIMAELKDRLQDNRSRDRVLELTARMLALQPENPPTEIPARIKNEKDPAKRTEAYERYVLDVSRQQMESTIKKIVSDIIETIYGEANADRLQSEEVASTEEGRAFQSQVEKIEKLVMNYVKRMYLDPMVGQTRFFGRALAATLVRESVLQEDPSIKKDLAAVLKSHNLELENFVGNTIVVNTDEGKEKVTVEDGSLLYNRSYGVEAAAIAWSSEPHNTERGKKLGLIGKVTSVLFQVEGDAVYDGMSFLERLKAKLSQKLFLNKGFSHVGYANVLEDEQTGVKMLWALDNYPYPHDYKEGGVRISGLEDFGGAGHFGRLGVAKYDHKKFWEFAQSTVKNRGYEETAWESFSPQVNEKGDIVRVDNPPRDDWKVEIDRAEFERLHSIENPNAWYKEWAKRTTTEMRRGMMTQKGVFFNWVDKGFYYKGGTYCSQLGVVASMVATGIDMQKEYDHLIGAVAFLQRIGKWAKEKGIKWLYENQAVMNTLGIDLSKRIVAPSGLATQDFVEDVKTYNYSEKTVSDISRAQFQPPYVELRPSVTTSLYSGHERSVAQISRFKIDPDEVKAFVDRWYDFGASINGDRGISEETIELQADPGQKAKATHSVLKDSRPAASFSCPELLL